jgi:N-acetylmuramoyl-L-alanine amidase
MNPRGTHMFALLLLAATATIATAVLKAVRTVVGDFERIVRQYPSSGYADDALWRASRVSIDAFKRFRDAHDKDAAARLLRALASQYPASRQAKQAPAQLRALDAITPVSTSGAQPAAPEPQPRPQTQTPPHQPPAAAAAPAPAAPQTGPLATIKGIRRAVLPDTVRIIVDIDKEVTFRDERLANPARVFVDLPATRSNPALIDQTIRFESDADVVRQVRVGRHPNQTTRIVLDVEGVSSYSVYPLYNPYRLVIDCLKATPAAKAVATAARPVIPPPVAPVLTAKRVALSALVPTPSGEVPPPVRPPLLASRFVGAVWARALPGAAPANAKLIADAAIQPSATLPVITTTPPSTATVTGAPSRNVAGGLSMARQLGLGVSRIVIDPGHGGHDPGAKAGDMTEAELVLDLALRLEKLLTAVPGVEVVLTRRTDDFVPLQERTTIANRESADLFLSIHGNANPSAQVRGV